MDEALSRLIPTQRIGNDGFTWWVGQIEGTAQDEKNNKGGYRYKVRIVGDHTSNKEVLPTKNLPWATAIMPITTPFAPGNICGANPQLVKGCWVIGFYLDTEKQKPIIMGSIGQVPGATSIINDIDPNDSEAFKTGVRTGDLAPIPSKDGEEGADGTAKTGGGLATGRKRGDGEEDVPLPPAKVEAIKDEQWCQIVAEKCKDVDLKTQMTNILGELLAEIQNNNGNIGTYYVSKVTGGINSAVSEGRSKVNKAIRVVREFLARVKGWITTKIQEAVDALVKAILQPNESGNVLTPVTEWFNNILKDLGCKMADLGERLEAWLTNLLMSYINQIYRAAICQIDELVNGIISKIQQLMNDLLDSVLGPLQDILGAIAAPLDLIGQAINYVLKLLGISCSGPDQTCAKYKKVCTTGEKKKKDDDEDFLDKLLGDIDNLFGDTPADYTQYICDEAFTGRPLELTTVGFIGGVPAPGTTDTKKAKLTYTINDVTVKEGDSAVFTVTRGGFLDISSSLKFSTIKKQGTATAGSDYLEQEGILGFAPGETQKTINIQTLVDQEKDPEETFFIRLKKNSPVDDVKTVFVKNIGKGTITEKDVKKPYDPYQPEPVDPFVPIPDPPTDTLPTNPNVPDDGSGDGGDDDATDTTPSYSVIANRTSCPEGEFIIYTISTSNLENGTILYYNLTGNGITPSDIVGNKLSGSFIINNNQSKVTVGIEEDSEIEDVETLTFTIAGTGASVDVLITVPDDQDIDDIDQGVGDTPETVFEEFRPPTAKEPITDENGGIIEIPIDDPGDSWLEPPIVIIGGEGSGATGIALLDNSGSVSEIRIQSPGYGYKLNRASDNDVRCIIDAFTILRPGIGYTSVPDMYVNGELGIAEAVINNDGFVIGARILNREITFDRFPAVDIVGGGGYGAKLLPSLACLDTEALSTIGATKIGTGKYIDCP
tara:strand:+ start:114 stop:2939 length:2826 start_codon:yes stop_codon:yes gene_type:complete